MSEISYAFSPLSRITAQSQTSSLNKVLKLTVVYKREPTTTLYCSINEIKSLIESKRYTCLKNIGNFKDFINLILRWIAITMKLKFFLHSVELKSQATCQLRLKIENQNNLIAIFYADEKDKTRISKTLQQLHEQFMYKYSCTFNSKITFPLILGHAMIARKELNNLKPGSIIIFDSINLRKATLRCKIGNFQADISFS